MTGRADDARESSNEARGAAAAVNEFVARELAAANAQKKDAARLAQHLAAELEAGRAELEAHRAALAAIEASRAYRLVLAYYRAVERLAPAGTRRRRVYGATGRSAARGVRAVLDVAGRGQAIEVAEPSTTPDPLVLPTATVPQVSVVIPVHGKWDVTRRCLQSLVDHPSSVPHEVVVVDDASPDDTRDRLSEVTGLTLVALDVNRGFVGAVNAGIAACTGDVVVLLNNDTEVTDGWLEALLMRLDHPGVGLVGAKLVYPDGRLQEAGGIMFDDATGWNYGRLDDPWRARYNVSRDVDYCSGAAVAIRRRLLDELGGLNEEFAPAYYDDVDLAFAVRERGLRVVYEPTSVVVHHEGVSHGTDETTGVKRFQSINRHKMVAAWSHRLSEHFAQDPALVEAAARRHGAGTIVFIDNNVPRPDEDAGSVRTFAFLVTLRRLGFTVVFIPHNGQHGDVWEERLLAEGVEVFTGPESIEGFLLSIAPVVKAVIGARVTVAWPYVGLVRRILPGVPFIFDTVDLHHLRERREAELAEDSELARRAEVTRALELGFVMAADETIVVSPVEAELLEGELPGAVVRVVPIVHTEIEVSPRPEGRSGMLFVGSFAHPPNADAVRWFTAEVLPLVRERVPDAVLRVVGRGAPPDLVALAEEDPGLEILGWLPTLDDVYETARVSVAPLRYGAGVKGKVAEALTHGVPVVGTGIAVEGMHMDHGSSVWCAEEPSEMADGIVALMEDDVLWSRLSRAGRAHVHTVLGVERFERLVRDALVAVGVHPALPTARSGPTRATRNASAAETQEASRG